MNPDQPPPTTPIRRPAGIGSCCAMISFTLATAVGVRLTGKALGVVSILGCTVVAILFSSMKPQYISRLAVIRSTNLLDGLVAWWMQIVGEPQLVGKAGQGHPDD